MVYTSLGAFSEILRTQPEHKSMDIVITLILALILCVFSVVLVVQHRAAWERRRDQSLDLAEADFFARQYSRRIQTSAMILVVGVLIGLTQLTMRLGAWWFFGNIVLLLLTLGWIVLLALADLIVTRVHYLKLNQRIAEAQARETAVRGELENEEQEDEE